MFVGLFVVGFCALRQFGAKADIDVTLINVDMPIINPIYFDVEKTECSIDENSSGETTLDCNIAVIRTFPNDTNFNSKIMGLSMGEFVVPSGIETSMKMCEVLDEAVILGPFFLSLFPTKTCPPEPKMYVTKGYVAPLHLLPDSFAENTYKLILELKQKKQYIMKVETTFQLSY